MFLYKPCEKSYMILKKPWLLQCQFEGKDTSWLYIYINTIFF